MQLLGSLKADRLINQIVASGSLERTESTQAVNKLRDLGKTAIPKIMGHLRTTRLEESGLIVELLGRLLNRETFEHYLKALTDEDARVVAGVTKALSRQQNIDYNRLLALLDNPAASKLAILEVLSAHQHKVDAELLLRQAYKLERGDQSALFRIIEQAADERLIPELISRIEAKDPAMRAHLARVLARFNTPPVQEALHKLLEDDNKLVRLTALEGLSNMDADMDIERVCKLLKDPDLNTQGKAIEAVVKINHPQTVRYLLDPLRDESEYARRAAVEVLNAIGDTGSIKDLFIAIKDSDWWVRSRAADALGNIGGPRVVDAVVELLKDEDEFIRRSAIEIINATKDERSFDGLINALEDNDWWVRERAIDGLAELGNKKAVPVLIKMLEKEKPESNTALQVVTIRALDRLGSPSALEVLLLRLEKGADAVKKEAILALGNLTDEAQAQRIIQAIGKHSADSDLEVRQAAAEAMEAVNSRYFNKPSRRGITSSANQSKTGSKTDTVETLVMPSTISRGAASMASQYIDPSKLQADDVLGNRYRFVKMIGKGAFGSVCLMEDLVIKEEIILKFLNAQVASDESIIKRFVYELRFARKITHHNVIRLFDMITFGNSSAIAMEYFPSHTLNMEMPGVKPMAVERALAVAREICAGMAAAHKVNVVHRDLKPGNVLINDADVVKVVDFGVAAATRQMDTRLTKTGLLVGTPTYMAPEQVLGRDVDARTDIYSLGVIMYEMLTGKPPYTGGDSMAIMYQHVQGKAVPPKKLNPELPNTLSAVILKTMADDADKRFQSMEELKQRLDAFAS